MRAAQVEDDQVLADNLTAPQPLAGGAAPAGWEVLGYDLGLLPSWLCNDLYRDAVAELAVAVGERGLLRERAEAEAVAAWANARTDTKPVTWFAAAVVEWSDRVGRPTTEPPPPADRDRRRPWWRRATGKVMARLRPRRPRVGWRGGWGPRSGRGRTR
ncbi:hypothetical protein BX265_7944 [Streptomyces sp. TLI_235]|nr:hypothetical protein BX265_7944 [Streptomyces sp. TLI_235]